MRTRLITILLVLAMAAFLCACGSEDSQTPQTDEGADKIEIVATIFPEYDWVMNILGDNPAGAEVTMLLDSGVDLHSFQPTSEDMMKISTCDLFIYVGGESDSWVEGALETATNEDMKVINLLDVLGENAKEEEIVEGMEAEHEHEGDEDHEGEEGHEEEGPELDEHVWLSVDNARALCGMIGETLGSIDPDNAQYYEDNLEAYQNKLDELDQAYQEATEKAKVKTLLFGDRFPFRYLTDEYGLKYYAAFVGCSAESEASFETIQFLAKKADELGLKSIMTIENSDQKLADTIKRTTKTQDQKILTMNSMQSVTQDDVDAGASYISIMEENLAVLKEALQ